MNYAKALDYLNEHSQSTLLETLEIRYIHAGDGYLEAEMPVDERHHQPMGILHGGATAALAESVGSAASAMVLHGTGRYAVGLELAINHLRSVRSGRIVARADSIHLGRSTHLWQIRVTDADGKMVALAKLTMMVLEAEDETPGEAATQ